MAQPSCRLSALVLGLCAVWTGPLAAEPNLSHAFFSALQPVARPTTPPGLGVAAELQPPTALTVTLTGPATTLLTGTAMAAWLLYHEVDGQVTPSFHIGGSREGSAWISQVGELGAYLLPAGFYLASWLAASPRAMSRHQHMAKELFADVTLTTAAVYGLKFSASRLRPNGEDEQSFPSAHAALAFSCATAVALHYPWYVGVPSLVAAAVVGLSRFDLEKHHLSDVVAGAGLGAFFALTNYWTRSHTRPEPHSRGAAPQFSPLVTAAGPGFGLQFTL